MNNLLSYCGLVNARKRIRASNKDLPLLQRTKANLLPKQEESSQQLKNFERNIESNANMKNIQKNQIQGVQRKTFILRFALIDRIMQARFCFRGVSYPEIWIFWALQAIIIS